jgi:hypothetical protein
MLEAIGLINMALRRHSPLEGIDVGAFVDRLLHLGSIVNDEAVGIVLGNLIRNFPDEVLPFASETLRELMRSWTAVAERQDAEEEDMAAELLETIKAIVETLGEASFSVMLDEVLGFVVETWQAYPASLGIPGLIGIGAACCCRVRELCPAIETLTELIIAYLREPPADDSCERRHYLLADVAPIFCAVVKQSPTAETAAPFVELVDSLIVEPDQDPVTIGSGFIILACFLETLGPGALELADRAVSYLSEPAMLDMDIVGAVYLIVAALHVTNGEFAQQLNQPVIDVWAQAAVDPEANLFKAARHARVALVGLSYLIQKGVPDLIEAVVGLIVRIALKTVDEEDGEAKEEDEEFDSEDADEEFDSEDADEDELPVVPMPVDTVKEFEFFREVAAGRGLWDQLDEDTRALLAPELSSPPSICV